MLLKSSIHFSWVIILALVFTSCTTNKFIFLDPEVKRHSISSNFSVVPLKNEWIYENRAPNLEQLEQVIMDEKLTRALASKTKNTIYQTFQLEEELFFDTEFESKSLEGEEISIRVNLPPKEVLEKLPGQYIVFLEDYDFRTGERIENENSTYAGHDPKKFETLIFITEFYVWDKSKEKAINWGTIAAESRISEEPDLSDYDAVLNQMATIMIQNSPFLKQR